MTDLPLTGKKILFFCPKFFGYEKEMLAELQKMGADVTYRSAQPTEHPWFKGLLRIFPKLAWNFCDLYFFSWLKQHGPERCDLIFIVKGEGLSPNFIKHLRERYEGTKIVLYLFDSIKNCSNINLKFSYIDEIFSFDPDDCDKIPRLNYRPLFFIDKYQQSTAKNTGNKLFFVGTLNGDRPEVICRLLTSLGNNSTFDYWLYVRSRLELTLRRLLDRPLRKLDDKRFFYAPMSSEMISDHLNQCSAVLDIEHPGQTGLTMRTFEVIASGKKLITTNGRIKKHDFYDPARICVIDRLSPSVPDDFIIAETPPLSADFADHYSLHGWILEILNKSLYKGSYSLPGS